MSLKTKLAVVAGKLTKASIQAMGKKGTHFPGVVASKIDREIIKNIRKPETIMTVTGTNGKTTTANIIADVLSNINKTFSSNRLGSNIYEGITTELISKSNLLKKYDTDYAVYEVDELWTVKIMPELKPNTLTITNLTQDSYERNVNVYYIFDKIQSSISKDIKLILNGDDAISSYISPENERVYYSVDNIYNEESADFSRLQDLVYTNDYSGKVKWIYRRYGNIGKYTNNDGSFTNPKSHYQVTSYDEINNHLNILDNGKPLTLPIINKSIENIYNQIAAYATLRENGFSHEQIYNGMLDMKIYVMRYGFERVGNKNITRKVSKRNNPVAASKIIDEISKSDRSKTIILIFDYLIYPTIPIKSPSWYSAVDFNLLNNKVDKFIIKSIEANEIKLAMVLQGFPEEKIKIVKDLEDSLVMIDKEKEEDIYILHDLGNLDIDQAIAYNDRLKKYLNEEN